MEENDLEAGLDLSCFPRDVQSVAETYGSFLGCVDNMVEADL